MLSISFPWCGDTEEHTPYPVVVPVQVSEYPTLYAIPHNWPGGSRDHSFCRMKFHTLNRMNFSKKGFVEGVLAFAKIFRGGRLRGSLKKLYYKTTYDIYDVDWPREAVATADGSKLAPERFGLSFLASKASVLDRYTTGLLLLESNPSMKMSVF